ncbi:Protein BLISTER [Camellia lanceoleosa]|uniref:Protein BLISTER n=1 Tax=Camellia lanceoleosa TaxID=1840588 RepID=A0ACC0FI47_9ERIC|nr:Protein BLISTER [Camellia lanceoleosa]
MGSVRLCVTSSAHIPSRASLRWGLWTFSLPIWVEEGPPVELAVAEADQRLDKAGRDPRSWNRSIPKFLGVKDYLRRFKEKTEFRGTRVRTPSQSGSHLGFSAELGPTTLGQANAQRDGFCPIDTNKWVRPVVPTVEGPMTAVGNQKQLVDHLSQPNPCGFLSGQPDDPNPSISRVFASLHVGVGSRNTIRAVGLSAEAVLPPMGVVGSEVVALQSSQCLADAGPLVGVIGGETMELQSLLGSSDDGCHLGKAVSVTEECSQVFLGCPDKRGFVEDVGTDCRVDSVGELVLVVCPEVLSHGDQEVARIHEEDLESLKKEYANVQLECNASDERAKLLAFEVTSLEEKRVAEEVGFSSLVVDGEVVPQFPCADGLALVLQPLAMEDGGSDDLREQHQNLIQNSGGLDGLAIPSSEAVSNWVLERIGEVSRCLGVSFVGHEEEALRLFAAVEASWRQGIPSSGVVVVQLFLITRKE